MPDPAPVLACPLGSPGYAFPAIAVARALRARGHDVAFANAPWLQALLRAEGFAAVTAEDDERASARVPGADPRTRSGGPRVVPPGAPVLPSPPLEGGTMRLAVVALALVACTATDEVVVDDTEPAVDTDLFPDVDHDGAPANLDCDDANPLIGPWQPERCNDVDDDCDGKVDRDDAPIEGGQGPWFRDQDVDGYGDDATAVWTCGAQAEGWVLQGGDCDDTDPNVRPDFGAGCTGATDTDVAAASRTARPYDFVGVTIGRVEVR